MATDGVPRPRARSGHSWIMPDGMVSCHWSFLHLARLASLGIVGWVPLLCSNRYRHYRLPLCLPLPRLARAYPNESAACFSYCFVLFLFAVSHWREPPALEHWHGEPTWTPPGIPDRDIRSAGARFPSSGSRCLIGTPLFHLPAVLSTHSIHTEDLFLFLAAGNYFSWGDLRHEFGRYTAHDSQKCFPIPNSSSTCRSGR